MLTKLLTSGGHTLPAQAPTRVSTLPIWPFAVAKTVPLNVTLLLAYAAEGELGSGSVATATVRFLLNEPHQVTGPDVSGDSVMAQAAPKPLAQADDEKG